MGDEKFIPVQFIVLEQAALSYVQIGDLELIEGVYGVLKY